MACYLSNSVTAADLASGAGFKLTVVEDPAGTPDNVVVTSTTHTFNHYALSAVAADVTALGPWLKAQLDAGTLNANTYTVTFTEATGFYTITASATNINLKFTGADGNLATGNLLGFNADKTGATATWTSDNRATRFIVAAMPGHSLVSDDYEARNVAADAELDDGTGYSVRVGTPSTYYDCSLQYEPHAAVFTRLATTAVPYTYQRFWEDSRSRMEFLLRDTNIHGASPEGVVLRLRADAAAFDESARARQTPDYDGEWNLHLRCRVLGRT